MVKLYSRMRAQLKVTLWQWQCMLLGPILSFAKLHKVAKQVWYADDSVAGLPVENLKKMVGPHVSLGPRRSGGGADEGEEESAWYLLHAHARIYHTFYRIIIRICTSNV